MMKLGEIRAQIAARRDLPILRQLAKASRKFLSAYDNLANWDVRINGEAAALARVTSLLPGVVLDVGANAGQWAEMALDVIGAARALHCFEVVPATFERLQQSLGERPNLTLNRFGLGATRREIEIFYYPSSSDRTSAYELNDGFEKQRVKGQLVVGDEYLRDGAISRVAYLKIDVEGMEMDVLQGFDHALRSAMIDAVQFEHGTAHVVSRHFLQDFVEFFRERDFALYRCFPGRLEPLDYRLGVDENFVGQNFVALSKTARAVCL
jgi:FkbM family methyltransferase